MELSIQTPFSKVYDNFLSRITDDLYIELNKLDTYRMMQNLLTSAIPWFEFPRVSLDYEISGFSDVSTYCGIDSDMIEVEATIYDNGFFYEELSDEEINILGSYMIVEWLGQQLASIENTRMKYSGSDFKFTSQANHMQKLLAVKKDYEREGFHLQRLYKRRKRDEKGVLQSTMSMIMETSPVGRIYTRRLYNDV